MASMEHFSILPGKARISNNMHDNLFKQESYLKKSGVQAELNGVWTA